MIGAAELDVSCRCPGCLDDEGFSLILGEFVFADFGEGRVVGADRDHDGLGGAEGRHSELDAGDVAGLAQINHLVFGEYDIFVGGETMLGVCDP